MQHFALNHIDDWDKYDSNQGIIFEVVGTQRRLQFAVMAEMETRVYLYHVSRETGEVETRTKRLLGVGVGYFTVDVRVSHDMLVEFHSDAPVHVRHTDRNQTVARTEDAPFTTSDPGRAVPKEMDIVMNMVMRNQNKLMGVLEKERKENAKEREELKAQVAKQSQQADTAVPKKVVDDDAGGESPKTDKKEVAGKKAPKDASGSDGDDD